jgi:DNA-binding XRE family transcriptional regulator
MRFEMEVAMRKAKSEKLERAGWEVGDTQGFLGLSDADMAVVNVRVSLARELRRRRISSHLTQAALAARIGSSQSRVAKMEAGDPTVSIDLLLRSLFTFGSTNARLGRVIAKAHNSK